VSPVSHDPAAPERPIEADWLALREPADGRARDAAVPALLPPLLAALKRRTGGRAPRVVDLGAGTGANLRWLATHLPDPDEQSWTLVDHDPSLLALGPVQASSLRADVTDLSRVLSDIGDVDLVTAAALLDLLDGTQIAAIVEAVVDVAVPALFSLSVDGLVTLDPRDPDDRMVGEAFDAHQRRAGLLGPDAAAYAAALFRERGARVLEVPTPWLLDPAAGDAGLVASWLEGRAAAAAEERPDLEAATAAWLDRRCAGLRDGFPRVVVGHVDLLVLPH
jgi:trans-aconitate methyltransferase